MRTLLATPLPLLVALACGAGALLLLAVVYRWRWRRRYGGPLLDGQLWRLRGAVAPPTPQGSSTVVCRADRTGVVVGAEPFELVASGRRLRVEANGALLVPPRPLIAGERVTVDAMPLASAGAERLYREAPQLVVSALRISAGTWPELRWLSYAAIVAGVVLAGVLLLAAQRPTPAPQDPDALRCPPGTVPGGGLPPREHFQWCELRRDEDESRRGAQEHVKHGPWLAWGDDGRLRQRGEYHYGRATGEWRSYHDSGVLSARGRFFHGQRVGEWVTYWPNGAPREIGEYSAVDQRRVGTWRLFDEHRQLRVRRVYSTTGELAGVERVWSEDGRAVSVLGFARGVRHGPWLRWSVSSSGAATRPLPPSGVNPLGPPGGQLVERGEYDRGKKSGEWTVWNEAGQILRRGTYRADRRDGAWTLWCEQGCVKEQLRYAAGQLVEQRSRGDCCPVGEACCAGK